MTQRYQNKIPRFSYKKDSSAPHTPMPTRIYSMYTVLPDYYIVVREIIIGITRRTAEAEAKILVEVVVEPQHSREEGGRQI